MSKVVAAEEEILCIIEEFGMDGIHQMAICRLINGIDNYQKCKQCRNSSERWRVGKDERYPIKIRSCTYSYSTTSKAITNLENRKLIAARIERRRDKDMTRGWDYFLVCRPYSLQLREINVSQGEKE